jgi:hypothetical protein
MCPEDRRQKKECLPIPRSTGSLNSSNEALGDLTNSSTEEGSDTVKIIGYFLNLIIDME